MSGGEINRSEYEALVYPTNSDASMRQEKRIENVGSLYEFQLAFFLFSKRNLIPARLCDHKCAQIRG